MKVGLIQLNSTYDWEPNLQVIRNELIKIKDDGAEAAFLPECFYSMSDGLRPTQHLINLDDPQCPHRLRLSRLAKETGVALIGGSVAARLGEKVVNRVLNFDREGKELPHYDKRKLFACRLKDKSITESDIYTSGNEQQLLEFQSLKIGLGVCFDIRFSEFALAYGKLGANCLTYSSAFTVPTGKAHWHILNRARAIETQTFVISSAQWGKHNERITTYGHSLIVSPWGEILLDLGEGVGSGVVDLDLEEISKVRRSVLMER